jgi:polyhydroxybutyrate depolymerase
MWQDITKCPAKTPVSVLEVHGTADTTIVYTGGQNQGHAYPGAATSVADWTTFDGCSGVADTSSPNLDLEVSVLDAETTVTKYATGCKAGTATELWTITDAPHIPLFTKAFVPDAVDFMLAHPKP